MRWGQTGRLDVLIIQWLTAFPTNLKVCITSTPSRTRRSSDQLLFVVLRSRLMLRSFSELGPSGEALDWLSKQKGVLILAGIQWASPLASPKALLLAPSSPLSIIAVPMTHSSVPPDHLFTFKHHCQQWQMLRSYSKDPKTPRYPYRIPTHLKNWSLTVIL